MAHEKNKLTSNDWIETDSLTKEGMKYSNRVVAEKTATNNQWIGANHLSTEGTKYSNRHQAEKTATNNQWVSRNMPDEK